jgi:hypothetical protein
LEDIILWRDKNGRACVNIPHSIIYHSPCGFEWGYGGSGPADLALNILYAVTGGQLPPAYRGGGLSAGVNCWQAC